MNTIEDYRKFLAEVRTETGIEAMTPDEDGLVSVDVDGKFNVNLQFVAATGQVLCFVEVAELPKDAPKDVYRELLSAGLFGRDTAGGHFTLEQETETVVYNYVFDLERAARDIAGFVHAMEGILHLCDDWLERIKGGAHEDAHAPEHGHFGLSANWA